MPGDAGDDNLEYSAGASNAPLDVEALLISRDEMAIAGSFAARLIFGGADELVLENDVPGVMVDGSFQVTLPRMTDPSSGRWAPIAAWPSLLRSWVRAF